MTSLLVLLVLIFASESNQVHAQSDGDVRLVGGLTTFSGRVELYYQGEWGTICDDEFSLSAAQVICKSLGISDARARPFTSRFFGVSTGRILLDDVRCSGNETNILHCSHRTIGFHNCYHVEDVAVDCYGQDLGKTGELQNGTSTDGVLVLNHTGVLGTVCMDRDWATPEARVACRMLGHDMANVSPLVINRTRYGESSDLPVLMARVRCTGDEENLSMCRHSGAGVNDCAHDKDFAIDCLAGYNLEVTLINDNGTSGELQVRYNIELGAVCANTVDDRSLKVYCHMLGYGSHQAIRMTANVLTNDTTVLLSRTYCQGYEKSIADCEHQLPIGEGICTHAAVVYCMPQGDIPVRLTEGNSTYGRLQVQYNGLWGGVCDDLFTVNAAKVFCRMLNLPSENAARYVRPNFTYVFNHLYTVNCAGDESNLNDCYHNQLGYHGRCQYMHVWISCA